MTIKVKAGGPLFETSWNDPTPNLFKPPVSPKAGDLVFRSASDRHQFLAETFCEPAMLAHRKAIREWYAKELEGRA